MKTLEFHIIQTYNASNPNRDANGDPKTVTVGGVRRARISSQSLKRAMRDMFAQEQDVSLYRVGKRTKMRNEIEKSLVGMKDETGDVIDEKRAKKFADFAWNIYSDKKEKKEKPNAAKKVEKVDDAAPEDDSEGNDDNSMIFVDERAVRDVIAWVARNTVRLTKAKEDKTIKDEFLDILLENEAIDIALFGRMTASQNRGHIDGACLVAHAFSTNRLVAEFDFFTAVDDMSIGQDDKVGMLDSKGYNASTFYRNLVLDVTQLEANLGGDVGKTEAAIRAFVRATIESYPKALSRSSGAPPQPAAVVALIRDNARTTNLGDAFLRPVQGDGTRDVAEISVEHMATCYKSTVKAYSRYRADKAFIVAKNENLGFPDATHIESEDLIEEIVTAYRASHKAAAA